MKRLTIAIDGPAGAGKSTVAKMLAKKLGYLYIDTGAMYRAFAYIMLKNNISLQNEAVIGEIARTIDIQLVACDEKDTVLVNGEDVTDAIRSKEVTSCVSAVSAIGIVRERLVDLQRKMAGEGGTILDGRDIGTVVSPKAELKFFLTASPEERTKRRMKEMEAKGIVVDFKELLSDIKRRDKMDSERAISPLKQAKDALFVDNSAITLEETVELLYDKVITYDV